RETSFLAGLAGLRDPGRAVPRTREVGVAPSPTAAASNHDAGPFTDQVRQQTVVVANDGPVGDRDHEIIAGRPVAPARAARRPAPRSLMRMIRQPREIVHAAGNLEHDRSARAAVAAVRAAPRLVRLGME